MGTSKRIVVAGSGGMLGTDLVEAFRRATDFDVVPVPHARLDITDREAVRRELDPLEPTVVVNAAAFTDVDGAEERRDEAFRLNALGTRELADYCTDRAIRLVHFSTDQVFDGTVERPRTEDETPRPLNHYAATKLEGERWALKSARSLVLRVQWLYSTRRDRFSPLRTREVFTPFVDQIGCPTWTAPLSATVVDLVRREGEGLFHFAHDDFASWADVYAFVKTYWKLPVRLEPKRTEDVVLPAKRPLFSVMSNEKLKRYLGVGSLGSWRTSLKAFLDAKGI